MNSLPLVSACCAPGAEPIESEAAEALATRFRALADPTRIAIVNRLAGAGEVCVCDLVEEFELSQPTISHHLRLLRQAGLDRPAAGRPHGVNVLFVCVQNAGRSQMAQALYGREGGTARSAGTRPAD